MFSPELTEGIGPPAEPWTTVYDYDTGTGALIYKGWALRSNTTSTPPTSSPVWIVAKYTYSAFGSNTLVSLVQFAIVADQTAGNIWDNRASLTYA